MFFDELDLKWIKTELARSAANGRHNPGPYSIIREGDWKLIKFYEGPMELFDLKNDLGETKNLATAMPEKVKGLESRLLAHLKSVGAKMPKPNPAAKKLN